MQVYNTLKHLRCSVFAKTVNGLKSFTDYAKALHLRYLKGFWIHLWKNLMFCKSACFKKEILLFGDVPRNVWGHSPECLATFAGMFYDIPWNVWRNSPEYFTTLPGMFYDIPRNVWQHSPECLATFPGMFEDIPWNVWRHSPECLATFPVMFEDIPRNVWGHSPECLATFPRIYRSPQTLHSPHSVPCFCIPGFIHSLKTRVLLYFYNETRSSHRRCSIKKLFLKISQCSQVNTCVEVSFL